MNIGILACGGIASKMAVTLNEMEDACCVAVASRSIEKAKEFAAAYGIETAYGSYEELVKDDKIDLVYIASPHSHHYEHAMLCLNAGKAILCEKAFMANAKQAEEVLCLAKAKNLFVAEAIWTRYLPSRAIIEEILKRGEIGEITAASANLGYKINHIQRLYDPALAGGALLDVGVYPINFIRMFLGGDIQQSISSCTLTDTGVDAHNAMVFKYTDGKIATLHSNSLSATEQQGIIYGTKGYLIAENINNIRAVNVYDKDKKLVKSYDIPTQITGFEYQVRACMKAMEKGEISCEEMPHEETFIIMQQMDEFRKEWGVIYPFEK